MWCQRLPFDMRFNLRWGDMKLIFMIVHTIIFTWMITALWKLQFDRFLAWGLSRVSYGNLLNILYCHLAGTVSLWIGLECWELAVVACLLLCPGSSVIWTWSAALTEAVCVLLVFTGSMTKVRMLPLSQLYEWAISPQLFRMLRSEAWCSESKT